jgi:prepilin-type processing-associated H-X9-DG protein
MNHPNVLKPTQILVDLIVVLVIVAVLAAILFPVFACARCGKSREITCQSNLKQLGLGIIQYCQDYDGQMPDGLQTGIVNGMLRPAGAGWAEQIYPYLKSTVPYKCPDDVCSDSPDPYVAISYAYNRNALSDLRMADGTLPSATVALFEVTGSHALFGSWPTPAQIASGPLSPVGDGTGLPIDDGVIPSGTVLATGKIGSRPIDAAAGRHTNGANYLLADGHVKYLKPADVSSGSNATSPTAAQSGGIAGQAAGTGNPQFAATFSVE